MPTGHEAVHPPEKHQHTEHLNAALSKALAEWNPSDGTGTASHLARPQPSDD